MQEYGKTGRYIGEPQPPAENASNLVVTIFDMNEQPQRITLSSFNKPTVTFGREAVNDIVLKSNLASREHGRFVLNNGRWYIEDKGAYTGSPSTNGLIFNNSSIVSKPIFEGDFIRIDDGVETTANGILFIFSAAGSRLVWNTFPTPPEGGFTIGRSPECNIVLPHVSVSKLHATIYRTPQGFLLMDNGSTNGVVVNNYRVAGRTVLHEKDVITITNSKLIFTSQAVYYCGTPDGISVDASNIMIYRGSGKKRRATCNNANLSIKPGELVAFIGGSGAGKSTIMNAMSGYLPPSSGTVYINGVDLYRNFDSLKRIIGYVPQSDIVYDNLSLYDMLKYTAKMRLPKDTSAQEREAAIDRAIALVEMSEFKHRFIKSFSGGQKKRASIAVELLSDPNLLFLDEPSSGLDPNTERSLMRSLRSMADSGKTIMLVTHSTLQLRLCDKIVFMGKGGNLCFFGSYDDALKFFGVNDIVDIYSLINDNAPFWSKKYNETFGFAAQRKPEVGKLNVRKGKGGPQLSVLCARYVKLIMNDKAKLLLLVLQPPLLAFLVSLVSDEKMYVEYGKTQGIFFALSCCAFWLGMLNAIQEICKERTITRREYLTGMSLGAYIASKLIVLGVISLIQSLLVVVVFQFAVGMPDDGILIPPFPEILITTFLTSLAATATGMFISSLFKNPDKATSVAPIMLMPQLLFSGIVFPLEGATKTISVLATCRWSMEAYGTTANLNEYLEKMGQPIKDTFEYTNEHMYIVWGVLLGFTVAFIVLTRLSMISVSKEKS